MAPNSGCPHSFTWREHDARLLLQAFCLRCKRLKCAQVVSKITHDTRSLKNAPVVPAGKRLRAMGIIAAASMGVLSQIPVDSQSPIATSSPVQV
jgi:hypothetical protein